MVPRIRWVANVVIPLASRRRLATPTPQGKTLFGAGIVAVEQTCVEEAHDKPTHIVIPLRGSRVSVRAISMSIPAYFPICPP